MRVFFFLILFSLKLFAQDPNILIYNQGNIQVNAEVNEYENIVAGNPIHGTITIVHDSNQKIDPNSFRLGNQSVKVQFVQSTAMSSYSNLLVSIYSFQLTGMSKGSHELPPFQVKIAGKNYQSQPLTIQVAG